MRRRARKRSDVQLNLLTVRMEDRCADTFNAAVGPDTCLPINRGGLYTFEEFIQRSAEDFGDKKWRFTPEHFDVKKGGSVNAANIGGEFHTFTPVAEFGPGVVQPLNDLLGLEGPPVPECLADASTGFSQTGVPQGATGALTQLNETGTQRVMCCIHPWMRSEIEVRK